MIWCHGIPDSSVVFLLLLLFCTPSELGTDCFNHLAFTTTDTPSKTVIERLKRHLLLDYPVSVPSNLKQDEFCWELWELYFINKELSRMNSVSGVNLTYLISPIRAVTKVVEDCKIEGDGCVQYEQTNISRFLESIPFVFKALRGKMGKTREAASSDFSNCTVIECQLDSFTTPDTSHTVQKQSSYQAAIQRRHYWGLILIPASLSFCLLFVLRHPCRKLFQRQPRYKETEV